MKKIWDFIVHGYIPLRCDNQRTGKISIKLLVLIIGVIIAYTYLIQEDKNMVDWIKNENDDEFAVKLDKGQSFIYNGDISGGVVDTMDAIDAAGLTVSLGDLVNVTADADTASCDMEIFVASA